MPFKYNIAPIQNEHLSCDQIVLATYARNYGRNYEMILAESWGFDYQCDEIQLGASLRPGYQRRRRELLEKYHGIKLIKTQCNSIRVLRQIVSDKLTKCGPVLLKCDIFNCSWNMSYHRDHVNHLIMIVGFNKNSEIVTIIDPFTSQDEYEISLSSVANPCQEIETFEMVNSEDISRQFIDYEITNGLTYNLKSDMFGKIEAFVGNLHDRMDELYTTNYRDVYAIPIVFNLNRIMHQRYCFEQFLIFCSRYSSIESETITHAKKLADNYKLLRIMLIKSILKRKQIDLGILSKTIVEDEKNFFLLLSHDIGFHI